MFKTNYISFLELAPYYPEMFVFFSPFFSLKHKGRLIAFINIKRLAAIRI